MITKICEICNKPFETKSPLKRICNREHIKVCKVCGESFILQKASPQRMIDREICYNQNCIKIYTNNKVNETNLKKYGVKRPIQNDKIKEKIQNTNLKKYGTKSPIESNIIKEKSKNTCINKYGKNTYMETEEFKQKSINYFLERYGVEHGLQSKEIYDKTKSTMQERYGVEHGLQSKEIYDKTVQTCIRKYGRPIGSYTLSKPGIQEKIKSTMQERYGVPYYILTPEGRLKTDITRPNKLFSNLLNNYNIKNNFEFRIKNYSYDLIIPDQNILIEINPTPYHNSTWHPYKDPKDRYYHYNKTELAKENGYHCIHIWDWDNLDKILEMLKPKESLYARKLKIKEISKQETNEFLDKYHLQNTCKGQIIRLGLYNNEELVQIMTFGKPRYNKNYEWELLRLCTKSNYKIIGGAEKLFKHFLVKYKPESILSYCDNSKFNGDVYKRLGFILNNKGKPNKHWYNIKTKQHITNNLLKQRGFDQLFNTNYGKGTSNEELMKEYGFVEIYDVGQASYIYKNHNK